jgi:hypothetical protein
MMLVSIAVEPETEDAFGSVWALDDEGRLWRMVLYGESDPRDWSWSRVETPDPNVDAEFERVLTLPRMPLPPSSPEGTEP